MRIHTAPVKTVRYTQPWLLVLEVVLLAKVVLVGAVDENEVSGYAAWPKWVLILFCISTVLLSAMYCGLTIGLLGMQTIYLEIISDAGRMPDQAYARKILPVRMLGHRLLATLLVGNMLALVLTSQLVAAIVGGGQFVNFILGTLVVLIFGEIIPMSFCNNQNNALWAGAKSLPALKVSLFVLWPIAKPLGSMLDWMVGNEPGQMYDREELKKLIRMHCEKFSDKSGIDIDQVRMMLSVMDASDVTVDAAKTPMEKAVMLEASTRLDTALKRRLWEFGISRVPVYQTSRDQVIGVLYVKDLIDNAYLGRDGDMTVLDFLMQHPRKMLVVKANTPLQEMLHIFEHHRIQLLFVEPADPPTADEWGDSARSLPCLERERQLSSGEAITTDTADKSYPGAVHVPQREKSDEHTHRMPQVINPITLCLTAMQPRTFIGIVTLEDVIERLIETDIHDEDEYSGNEELLSDAEGLDGWTIEQPPSRPPRVNFYSYAVSLSGESQHLSEDQLWALAYYFTRAYVFFATWNVAHVKFLLQLVGDVVVRVDDPCCEGEEQRTKISNPAISTAFVDTVTVDPARVLCTAGQPSHAFTLLLSGGIEVYFEAEGLRTELRSFSCLGEHVLLSGASFLPDYTAVVSRTSRLIRITQADVAMAERRLNEHRARRRLKPLRLMPGVAVPAATVVTVPPLGVVNTKGKAQIGREDTRVTIE
ncbi:hypothetical protein JKF63_06496 [Porcisia hertigi]|uniref:CNNM transmembrane domain-containing protein n=1 Tax=Porcisia hertigi TaxID=2761500 RepID=A0A836LEI3_9TRYP|nr:hypothetical protein JKF63_06496 [Porcisia hertigi]